MQRSSSSRSPCPERSPRLVSSSRKRRVSRRSAALALGLALTSCRSAGVGGAGPEAPAEPRTASFYSAEQASRGERVFQLVCSECHTIDQFSGRTFMGPWNGAPVLELYSLIATTMPYDAPASLSPQLYVDLVAYVLATNELPGGGAELPADPAALSRLMIEASSP